MHFGPGKCYAEKWGKYASYGVWATGADGSSYALLQMHMAVAVTQLVVMQVMFDDPTTYLRDFSERPNSQSYIAGHRSPWSMVIIGPGNASSRKVHGHRMAPMIRDHGFEAFSGGPWARPYHFKHKSCHPLKSSTILRGRKSIIPSMINTCSRSPAYNATQWFRSSPAPSKRGVMRQGNGRGRLAQIVSDHDRVG